MLITRISDCKGIIFILNDKALWLIYLVRAAISLIRRSIDACR